jgi:hypothetical protein
MTVDEPERPDPLEVLAAAWNQLSPAPPTDDLEQTDPLTRASVDWMQRSFRELIVPAGCVPITPTRRVLSLAFRPLAAAAVLLMLLGGPFLIDRPVITPAGDPALTLPSEPTLIIAAADAHHLELRSGPVRLILLTGSNEPNDLP